MVVVSTCGCGELSCRISNLENPRVPDAATGLIYDFCCHDEDMIFTSKLAYSGTQQQQKLDSRYCTRIAPFIYRLSLVLTLFRRRRGWIPQIPRHHPGCKRQEVHRCAYLVRGDDSSAVGSYRMREEEDAGLESYVCFLLAL